MVVNVPFLGRMLIEGKRHMCGRGAWEHLYPALNFSVNLKFL